MVSPSSWWVKAGIVCEDGISGLNEIKKIDKIINERLIVITKTDNKLDILYNSCDDIKINKKPLYILLNTTTNSFHPIRRINSLTKKI